MMPSATWLRKRRLLSLELSSCRGPWSELGNKQVGLITAKTIVPCNIDMDQISDKAAAARALNADLVRCRLGVKLTRVAAIPCHR